MKEHWDLDDLKSRGVTIAPDGRRPLTPANWSEVHTQDVLDALGKKLDDMEQWFPGLNKKFFQGKRKLKIQLNPEYDERYPDGRWGGVYSHNKKTITINTKLLDSIPENMRDHMGHLGKDYVVNFSYPGSFAHEMGHHVQAGLSWKNLQEWIRFFESKGKKYFENTLSKYAGTNFGEAFAETFAAITSNDYGTSPIKMLPRELESMMEKMLGIGKRKVALPAIRPPARTPTSPVPARTTPATRVPATTPKLPTPTSAMTSEQRLSQLGADIVMEPAQWARREKVIGSWVQELERMDETVPGFNARFLQGENRLKIHGAPPQWLIDRTGAGGGCNAWYNGTEKKVYFIVKDIEKISDVTAFNASMKNLGHFEVRMTEKTSYVTTLRHEVGHHAHLSLSREQRREWTDLFESRSKSWWSKNVSTYSSTNDMEAFAESFTAYMSPEYGTVKAKTLPRMVENMLEKLIGKRVAAGAVNVKVPAAPLAPTRAQMLKKIKAIDERIERWAGTNHNMLRETDEVKKAYLDALKERRAIRLSLGESPSPNSFNVVQEMADLQKSNTLYLENLKTNAEKWGLSVDDYINLLDERVKQITSKLQIHVNVPNSSLEEILNTGLKNQFETGTSRGLLDQAFRSEVESNVFGIGKNAAGADRPIYGYLSRSKLGEAEMRIAPANGYGEVSIRFKSSIKERSSVTFNDSFNIQIGKEINKVDYIAVKADAPDYRFAGSNDFLQYERPDTSYYEAQIYGKRPELKDIEKVIFRQGSEPSDNVKRILQENGIEWEVFSPGTNRAHSDLIRDFSVSGILNK